MKYSGWYGRVTAERCSVAASVNLKKTLVKCGTIALSHIMTARDCAIAIYCSEFEED